MSDFPHARRVLQVALVNDLQNLFGKGGLASEKANLPIKTTTGSGESEKQPIFCGLQAWAGALS